MVLSIAAGKTIASFARHLPEGAAIVRAMPNTPAAVGRGITVCCPNSNVTEAQRKLAGELLAAVGQVGWVADEAKIDAVTAVSGSGPAYVFLLAECLAKAGVAAGLDPALARQLADATVAGSGELLVSAAGFRRSYAQERHVAGRHHRRRPRGADGRRRPAAAAQQGGRGRREAQPRTQRLNHGPAVGCGPRTRRRYAHSSPTPFVLKSARAGCCRRTAGGAARIRENDMIDPTTNKGRIVTAALRLAAERRWHEVTMLDIAEASGLGLVALRREFPSKSAIVAAFTRLIDNSVLARSTRPSAGTSSRDAIFEVVMSRFDAMQPYKAGLRSIFHDLGFEPELARRMFSSQAWMLNAAGIPLNGIGGTARVVGLASVYAAVFRTWLEDDDIGLSRTMAALDRRLRRGEERLQTMDSLCSGVSRLFEPFWRSRPHGATATAAVDTPPPAPGTGAL